MRRAGMLALAVSALVAAGLVTAGLVMTLRTRPGTAGCGLSVAVGGVAGLGTLADPGASWRLRRSCRVGLYIHDYAWTRMPVGQRRRILALFPGRQDVEFGLVDRPERWFDTVWATQYAALGVHGRHAHVNALTPQRMASWDRFVAAARLRGFASVAPVMAPNSRQFVHDPFDSGRWDYLRRAALEGGGLTVDAPSDFFLEQEDGYRRFVVRELTWARSRGLHSAFIVSPGQSGSSFAADTARVLDALRRAGATPDEFVVENYEPAPKPGYANPVGREDQPGTVAAVALGLVGRLDRR